MMSKYRSQSRPSRYVRCATFTISIVSVLVMIFLGFSSTVDSRVSASGGSAFRLLGTPISESLTVGHPVGGPGASFFGVNVRDGSAIGSTDASRFNQTPDKWVRWPGGGVGDRLDIANNTLYSSGGGTSTPPQSVSDFVHWCNMISCHAIIELPGEINNANTAGYFVSVIESAPLSFHPDYWEIGNEPIQWTHFNIAWSKWVAGQSSTPNPGQYALLVNNYTSKIRSVDPVSKIIGLPGVGNGYSSEPAWISAVVGANGPNINAVAVHTYPAGQGTSSSTLATFYASLAGSGSLTTKIPNDQNAILSACPTCTRIALFSDETSSATEGGYYDSELSGGAQAVYMMAETIEGLEVNIPVMDYFDYESSYPGAWYAGSLQSSMHPVFMLSSYFLNNTTFGQTFSATVSPSSSYLYEAIEADPTVSQSESLLLANTDTGNSYSIGLSGSGFPLTGRATVYQWDPTLAQPTVTQYGPNSTIPSTYTVPSQGILEVVVSSLAERTGSYDPGCATTAPNSGSYTAVSTGTTTATYTTPSLTIGSGGLVTTATGTGLIGNELAGQWIALYCVKPYSLPGGSGLNKVLVSFSYSYFASVQLATVCRPPSTPNAGANASVEAYEFGLTPTGRHGAASSVSLYSYSITCASASFTTSGTGTISTGWGLYSSADWVEFAFVFWAGGIAAPVFGGSTSYASDSGSFVVTKLTIRLS